MSKAPVRGPLLGRLGFRLMAAVGLALLPLALLAYVQASRFEAEAEARSEAALFGDTLQAAAPQIATISRVRGMAASLSKVLSVIVDDPDACRAAFRAVLAEEPLLSFGGFLPAGGLMECSTVAEPLDFRGGEQLAQFVADPRPQISVVAQGRATGEPVLIVSEPVYAGVGSNSGAPRELLGFLTLSLPQRALQATPFVNTLGDTDEGLLGLATFDAQGEVLTALSGMEAVAERLPADRPLAGFVSGGPVAFSGSTVAGDRRTFAVVPVVPDTLYILSSWPPNVTSIGWYGNVPLWVFPTAMWLASLFTAWLVAETQVLSHVRSLRRSIIAFSQGNRTVQTPDLSRAPRELRDVGDAYELLIDSVLHDEATLEDTVHQKEVLLREVHHRVKNNLQLIASIMNIQMRKAFSPEAKTLVKGLHDRVMSLATVHRELYQTTGLTDVKADELLQTIVAQVTRMGAVPGRTLDLVTAFDPIRLTPDQAVPLSLVLTEALTNVFKHAGTGVDGRVALSVSLVRLPEGRARLKVFNSVGQASQQRTTPPTVESTGLGAQLLQAFSQQLTGVLEVSADEAGYSMTLDFPVRALTEAEARFSQE